MASETGVSTSRPRTSCVKDRLQPGRIFCVDLDEKRIVADDELKLKMSARQPYALWLERTDRRPRRPSAPRESVDWHVEGAELERLQNLFGYSREDLSVLLVADGAERPGAGGLDGNRHAARVPVGPAAAAVQLLQAAVRAGHQSADRPDSRRARDVRSRLAVGTPGQHLRGDARALPPAQDRRIRC